MTTTKALRETSVTIDGEPVFPCWVDDSAPLWNGWAVPFFTAETGERVMAMVNVNGNLDSQMLWDGEQFSMTFADPDYETETWQPIDIGVGQPVYSIGGWSWVWSESQ